MWPTMGPAAEVSGGLWLTSGLFTLRVTQTGRFEPVHGAVASSPAGVLALSALQSAHLPTVSPGAQPLLLAGPDADLGEEGLSPHAATPTLPGQAGGLMSAAAPARTLGLVPVALEVAECQWRWRWQVAAGAPLLRPPAQSRLSSEGSCH